MQARFSERAGVDRTVRLVLAAFSLVALLHPNEDVAAAFCVPVLLIIAYWLLRRRIPSTQQGGTPAARAAPVGEAGRAARHRPQVG
jgi:hypothetical protein